MSLIKEKKLINILPTYIISKDSEDGVPEWTEHEKNLIIKRLKKLDDLKGFSLYGNEYMVPSWFYLLKDDELFEAFIRHPKCEKIIEYTSSPLCKKDFELSNYMLPAIAKRKEYKARERGRATYLMQNIQEYPWLFERNADKLKQLVNKGLVFNIKNLSEIANYPQYVLDLKQHGLLELNESMLINQEDSLNRYTIHNMSFVTQIIFCAEKKLEGKQGDHQTEIQIIKNIRAIKQLLHLGLSNKCYHYNLLTHQINPPHSLTINEYSEQFAPNVFKIMKKVELFDKLENDLSENTLTYQKSKI